MNFRTPDSYRRPAFPFHCGALYRAALFALFICQTIGLADSNYVVLQPTPGGLSATPDLSSTTLSNGALGLTWNGFAGPYQVETRSNLTSGSWVPIGPATNAHGLTVPASAARGFLRVNGKAPVFVSADVCADCHPQKHADWSQTIHAGAFDTLKAISQDKNPACVTCHTVGSGFSTGFIDETTTPFFAGVQCENCHGPAGSHILDVNNLAVRPVKTPSAMLCGGCHNGFHHPTYEEWTTAPHSIVVPDVAANFLTTNATARMQSCGPCHSGAVRLALLDWKNKGTLTLPSGHDAATFGVTCTVCHDAHKPNLDNTHSLRNPRYSTNFFSYNTSTSTTFTNQYNANVQVCGQCHNMRGAAPTDTSRPPHHSPQYNILIGDAGASLGYVPAATTNELSSHRNIIDQCTHCHNHAHTVANPSEENPNFTGHDFKPHFEGCVECHTDLTTVTNLMANTQSDITQRIGELKGLLDSWATTKAPDVLRTKYGALTWEYNIPGQLSNPTNDPSLRGPTATEQADVPSDIKSARMYLYLIQHDGSLGVHNAKYSRYLLSLAKTNVVNRLSGP